MIFLGLPAIPGWIGLGLALIAIEVLVAPGSYLLWVGVAAMAMGLVSALFTLGQARNWRCSACSRWPPRWPG